MGFGVWGLCAAARSTGFGVGQAVCGPRCRGDPTRADTVRERTGHERTRHELSRVPKSAGVVAS